MRYSMLLILVSMTSLACGDDDVGTADAPVGADGNGMTPDAPVGTPDAPVGTPDAPVGVPDAQPGAADANLSGTDAGTAVTVPQACARACTKLAECFMELPDPSCNTECEADLDPGCTPEEIGAVYDCGGGTCAAIETCLMAIGCVGM